MSSSLLQPLLDSAKVARLLGVEVETLGVWRRKGYGPQWYRIGKQVRYTETDIRVWMTAQAQGRLSPSTACPQNSLRADASTPLGSRQPASDLGDRR
jgi:predicted DNA-binding transcriptional regulator AlpA